MGTQSAACPRQTEEWHQQYLVGDGERIFWDTEFFSEKKVARMENRNCEQGTKFYGEFAVPVAALHKQFSGLYSV